MKRSNLISQCDCCDAKLSQVNIPHMNERHRRKLSRQLIDTLLLLKVKGKCSLLCVDEIIVAINYSYANCKEEARAEQICESLFETANDYFEAIIEECDVEYYELDTN